MEDKVIYIPSNLLLEALAYIEQNSEIVWNSGSKPTEYVPYGGSTVILTRYKYNDMRLTVGDSYSKINTFNELADFIKD